MALVDRDRLVCIGVVVQAHGLHGALKVRPQTDTPDYYTGIHEWFLDSEAGLQRVTAAAMEPAGTGWILTLQDVADRDAAEALVGAELLLERERTRPLASDEFFRDDLIGCRVETRAGEAVGTVAELMETGANDVLVVRREAGTVLVPLVGGIVTDVDTRARLIRIDPVPGLLDEDGA